MIGNRIKRVSLAVMVFILLLGAASFAQASPAQADETALAAYGADANPTGNPLGGGDGYVSPHGYSQAAADYVVTTVSELTSALSSAASGQVIWIPSGTTISISTDYEKTLKAGVVLASNRGQDGSPGGRITTTYKAAEYMTPILWCSSNSVISGLSFVGPGGIASTSGPRNCALRGLMSAKRIEVENCEISEFAEGGVYFEGGGMAWNDDSSSGRHWVHHCYIHAIQKHGFGYGVSESGGNGCSFLVEYCIFKDCRHHIMAQATSRSSANQNNYELRYNYFYDSLYYYNGNKSSPAYNHQVDCHGSGTGTSTWSGGTLIVHHNTFSSNGGHPNVGIRGITKDICEVYNNWTKKTSHSGVYSETNSNSAFTRLASAGSASPGTLAEYHMSVHDNWYGTTPPSGGDSVPSTPSAPVGTASGAVSTPYQYQTTTTDPDGDKISYAFSWGDGSTSKTSLLDSGATASATHTWTEPGTYGVSVRATDSEGNASAWSSEKTVEIAGSSNNAPAKPSTPVGTASGVVLTPYQYRTSTTDPDGDRVWYTFYWGDGSTSTTSLLDSGAAASVSHTWTQSSTYGVYVRATDSEGNDSAWSYGATVKIVKPYQTSATTNHAPTTPSTPSGTTSGETSTAYQYAALTTDPDADTLLYTFNWGDGSSSTTALVDSGVVTSASHTWTQPGTYAVEVKATDSKGAVSASSSALSVNVLSQPPAVPATPAPAPETPAAVIPSVETPSASPPVGPSDAIETPSASPPVGPSDAVEGDASGDPSPASMDNRGLPIVPTHGLGLGWWLLGFSVMIGASVVLTGAIVQEAIPKPPRWYDDGAGDR